MATQFDGKVALVTGGANGIGRATALAFAAEGAKVIIADVLDDAAHETVGMIKKTGGQAAFVHADVSKAEQVEAMVAKSVETYGGLDYAFNNAGVMGHPAPTAESGEDDWDRLIAINLKGVWLCMKYEIRQMLKQGGGAIVNTSSEAGLVGVPGISAYTASKHGVIGLTKTAGLEYARDGIRVNAVCPHGIRTPMTESMLAGDPNIEAQIATTLPMGRLGSPEEVAGAVIWLCSDAASWVNAHPLVVDAGAVAQ